MTRHLHLDIETRSAIELKTRGLYVYAKDKTTDILCAALAFDDDDPYLWRSGEELPAEFFDHIEAGGLVYAHNASFERELINNIGTRKYGWPYLYNPQMRCTMAMAYAMGLPGSLDGCSAALKVDYRKDMAGQRTMLKLCQPRSIIDGKIIWWDDQDDLKKLYEYCIQDVRVERAVAKRMVRLSGTEQKVWEKDQEINARGVKVDIPAAQNAMRIADEEKLYLHAEMRRVSDNKIATCNAVSQINEYLKEAGIRDFEGVAKADVTDLLARKNLPPDVRKILELRKEASKSTVAKLGPMIHGANADGRLRGCFQYCGANTGRWAGRRVQLHNLKRSSLKPETAEAVLSFLRKPNVDRETFAMIYGEPLSTIADCIRAFIIADEGKEFLCCDFASIEARVLAWLAGQESTLDLFREKKDIYVAAAQDIFGKDVISKEERAVGKVAVLALGFGGGVGAFQAMAKGYGVSMAPAFDALWARATPDQKEFVLHSWSDRGQKFEISQAEFIASDLTKLFWRGKNQAIVRFWQDLENTVAQAINEPGEMIRNEMGNLAYKLSGSLLFCKLPSGRLIYYPEPEIDRRRGKHVLTYMAEDGQSKKWLRFSTYGGSLAENVTQAVARDLLASAMLRLEARGFEVVAHIHDEIVCETPVGSRDLNEMISVMSEVPHWAQGLPIEASGWVGKRYRK